MVRSRKKRVLLAVGLTALSLVVLEVIRTVALLQRRMPEAYAAWDAGDMLVWYMATHEKHWPHNWDELITAVEAHPGLMLRGRCSEEPDYFGRMKRTVKIDWAFDPMNPWNPKPVTRTDGTRLPAYWVDPNEMIHRYLDDQGTDKPAASAHVTTPR